MGYAPAGSKIGKDGDDQHTASKPPQIAGRSARDSRQGGDDHALWTLEESYLALDSQSFGSGSHITDHHRTQDGCIGGDAHPEPVAVKEYDRDAEERNHLAIAVEGRVPQGAEDRRLAADAGQPPVHHVEESGKEYGGTTPSYHLHGLGHIAAAGHEGCDDKE